MSEIKNNLIFIFNEINHFINKVVFNICYWLPLLMSVLISYGFNLFNRTISIDDMAQSLYYGRGLLKIKGMRWGQWLVNRIFSTVNYTPFLNRFLGVIFLVLTIILLCTLFSKLCNKQVSIWVYSVVSCLFVSYPLINEFWEYYESLTIPLMFFVAVFSVLYLFSVDKMHIKNIVFIGVLMSIIMAGYESLVFVYITLVFIILYYKHVLNGSGKWVKEGFMYALPLFVALALKVVIGYLLLKVYGVQYAIDGDSGIAWINKGFSVAFVQLVFNAWYYGIRGLSYLPITVFGLCFIYFFIFIIYKQIKGNKNSLLIGIALMVSLFFLPILQGSNYGYRMAQTVHLFVTFVFFLILSELNIKNSKRILLIILLFFLSFRQSVELHTLLALNNQRSDNEANIVYNIGYRLYSEYDLNKNVVFVGNIGLGEDIESQIFVKADSFAGRLENSLRNTFGYDSSECNIPIVSTDVASHINWMINSNWQMVIKNYLSYFGYDINVDLNITEEEISDYYKAAKDNKMNPLDILELENVLLVYMGN